MGYLATKVLASLIVSAAIAWFNFRRAARGRQLIDDVENGRRCLACEGSDVTLREGNVHCGACGHLASLASLRASRVSDEAIAAVTHRDNRRGL